FSGIVLADTFNLNVPQQTVFLSENSERARRQECVPIQVIVGNPPWSAGQRSASDDNPNPSYPEMEARVAETYVAQSTATNKNSLYDTYKIAIRWASDRIGEQGVVAFVTNGSWIEGNVDSGVRACLAEEFTSVHVVNLRGNQRTQGERSRREGGKVFGQGSRAPVAITVLVRNPDAEHDGCRILYHDIGDYLKREEKLEILREAESIAGIDRADGKTGWREIEPDEHHDWVGQRDAVFQQLYPIGSTRTKSGRIDEAVFELHSNGFQTVGDSYFYSFSRRDCATHISELHEGYAHALQVREKHPEYSVAETISHTDTDIVWHSGLKAKLEAKKKIVYSPAHIRVAAWRPFVRQFLYCDPVLAHRPQIMRRMFPRADSRNRVISVVGIGSTKPFSALVLEHIPDLETISKGKCFPRWRYEKQDRAQGDLLADGPELVRVDNIPAAALKRFRIAYADPSITKDDIFDYVYGVLHSPHYRERFANDLAKGLPRIPLAADFRAFADAGAVLAELHLRYEDDDFPQYSLEVLADVGRDLRREDYRLGTRPMRFADKDRRDTLIVNDRLRLTGIPPEAHRYVVNGRTPLEWLMFYYYRRTDRRSGIVNDANEWFQDPRDLVTTIQRIVYLSVETAKIVNGFPDPMPDGPEFTFEVSW
ncbi:MAG: damage-inducible protein, partial [Chloroflexota bacterium]|nr:damage-inducible protein [Chloroflexota bacterium]